MITHRTILSLLLLLALPALPAMAGAQDPLNAILSQELAREMAVLKAQETPPYFVNYRVDDITETSITASFGDLMESDHDRQRVLTVSVRTGSPALDNSHELRWGGGDLDAMRRYRYSVSDLPLEDTPDAVRQALWQETDKAYKRAADDLVKARANVAVLVTEEDRAPDFAPGPAESFEDPPLQPADTAIDRGLWERRVRAFSKAFRDDPDIFEGRAALTVTVTRKHFVSSDGARIAHTVKAARLMLIGRVKAADGMVLPLYHDYFARTPDGLPDEARVMQDARALVAKLAAIKRAPMVDPYTGPAILGAGAAGVFFHEIFGHRVEGERQKSEYDAQTFKKKVGQLVLPRDLSVVFDPTIDRYHDFELYGSYRFDDQGMRARRVAVVDSGILRQFLMSQTPIDGFPASNGHGRAQAGQQPVARQSNLIVESIAPKSMAALRTMLVGELRRQGKPFGFLFADVTGGFTMTGRFIPNAFNVTPTEVYRVFVDGRPDELVRGVDLVGTPLSVFAQIAAAGGAAEVFTGTCGAESGGVPVSAVSPALFVRQIEIQRKGKSQERPPILPRPSVGEEVRP